MDAANQMKPQDDEPILCVRYTTDLGWVVRIAVLGMGVLLLYAMHLFLLREDYLRALIEAVAASIFLAGATDSLLTKHIVFYQDRVVKVWYFLGYKTIPYARGKLRVWPAYMRYHLGYKTARKSFGILEVDDTGRVPLLQMPIGYCFICVTPTWRKQVETVMRYLLGGEEGADIYEADGVFVKSTLPKDILSRDDLGKHA